MVIGDNNMIESFVIINEECEKIVKRYLDITGNVETCLDKEDVVIDDIRFEKKEDWCMLTMLFGDVFAEEFLLELSKGMKLVYCYSDDSQLDSEFLVISNNKVIRKRYMYSDTPELNEDEGHLSCEDREFEDWSDIDYLIEIVKDSPDKLF